MLIMQLNLVDNVSFSDKTVNIGRHIRRDRHIRRGEESPDTSMPPNQQVDLRIDTMLMGRSMCCRLRIVLRCSGVSRVPCPMNRDPELSRWMILPPSEISSPAGPSGKPLPSKAS